MFISTLRGSFRRLTPITLHYPLNLPAQLWKLPNSLHRHREIFNLRTLFNVQDPLAIEEMVEGIQGAGEAVDEIRKQIWGVTSGGTQPFSHLSPLSSGLTNQVEIQAIGGLVMKRHKRLQNGESSLKRTVGNQFTGSSFRKRKLIRKSGGQREK